MSVRLLGGTRQQVGGGSEKTRQTADEDQTGNYPTSRGSRSLYSSRGCLCDLEMEYAERDPPAAVATEERSRAGAE